jgi:hypothetical protein
MQILSPRQNELTDLRGDKAGWYELRTKNFVGQQVNYIKALAFARHQTITL